VAKPHVVDPNLVRRIEFDPDLNIYIYQSDRIIKVKDSQVKSSILPVLGITGLIKKILTDGSAPVFADIIMDKVSELFKEHISHFLFFMDSDDKEATAIVVRPLFEKDFEPIVVPNDPQVLSKFICTSHFPVEEDSDYDVIDFNHVPEDKKYTLSLARKTDSTKKFYPIIHNTSSISWKEKWEQRASIYDRDHDLLLTLPRNYAKEETKPVGRILDHIDSLIGRMNVSDDYDAEYIDMLTAKLPKNGVDFMMDAQFEDHRLISMLEYIHRASQKMKPSLLKAIEKCLGYMVALKVHCCKECRHLDEETL
jgi:hypothetical protein